MHDISNLTIREIALREPLTTRVFEQYKIDFCCGGRVPFEQACQAAGVDPSSLAAELEAVLSAPNDASGAAEKMPPGELIRHIVETHHEFTYRELTRLGPLAEKVATRHGENHSELIEILNIFKELAAELVAHMMKEENVLFPHVARLERSKRSGSFPLAPFGTVNNPIRTMLSEHDAAGEQLRQLRALSNDYTAPADACPSFKGLYAGLEDLERDLHRHIHLENNVLFPQAIEMEERALSFA